ncbi:MAG TPA: hypothetical protein VFI35_08250 [Actinomycetota bacterium]|nr:hypothetical protein [Actinomycetota bacterium]
METFPADDDGWRRAWQRLNEVDHRISPDPGYGLAQAARNVREPMVVESTASFAERVEADALRAWDMGRTFYVLRLNLGGTVAGLLINWTKPGDDPALALQVVEGVGWRLESAGYVYQPLRERSHILTDSAEMTGDVLGIYTFRRP